MLCNAKRVYTRLIQLCLPSRLLNQQQGDDRSISQLHHLVYFSPVFPFLEFYGPPSPELCEVLQYMCFISCLCGVMK